MYNLVIIYTPFQQTVIGECINQKLIERDCSIIDHNLKENKSLSKLANYNLIGNNALLKFFHLLRIRFKINLSNSTAIYIPHTEGVISNYLFQFAEKNCVDIILYYEGILSFYEFKRESFLRKIHVTEWLPKLLFFKFKKYDNIYPYNNPIVKNLIVPHLEGTTGPKSKKLLVEFDFLKIDEKFLSKKALLIIGTPLHGHDESDQKLIYQSFIKEINNLNPEMVYYKPHPNEGENYLQLKNFTNLHLINDKTLPVERVFLNLRPQYILTTSSSSVLNLKLANPTVSIISFWVSKRINMASKQIIRTFQSVNINTKILDNE